NCAIPPIVHLKARLELRILREPDEVAVEDFVEPYQRRVRVLVVEDAGPEQLLAGVGFLNLCPDRLGVFALNFVAALVEPLFRPRDRFAGPDEADFDFRWVKPWDV